MLYPYPLFTLKFENVLLAARGLDGPERVESSTAAGPEEGGISGVRARKKKVRDTVLNMLRLVSGVPELRNEERLRM
jgi:hypothetical protein